jgi:hypothetical protein
MFSMHLLRSKLVKEVTEENVQTFTHLAMGLKRAAEIYVHINPFFFEP